ncbi:hypothetical protein BHE74_00041180 [Ensete ventricosum]|nr:hypothetical protein BHE74_00041180 [Ensete ventricosum]RZS24593.1 hypothetical protein BHM03_00057678 [Ensete ventricosum]
MLTAVAGHGQATCRGSRLCGQSPAANPQEATAHRGNSPKAGNRLQAGRPQEDRLWVEAPPTGGSSRSDDARGGAAYGNGTCPQGRRPEGSHPWRRQRRPLDEGRRGGLVHPFHKRMIMPLGI